MKIFDEMEKRGHEELIFNYFGDVDLKMIVSLHDTTPGKTLGGLRMGYYDTEDKAVLESMRLSQIMTYQSAAADIDCGGGSVVLWGDPGKHKSEAYFRAVGRLIESLKGRISVYPDMGTDSQDFKYIQRETERTIYRSSAVDNSRISADITAYGVYWGIKACAKVAFGSSDLTGRSFTVQGLGKVGSSLINYLKKEDTRLIVTDYVFDRIKEAEDKYSDITVVRPEKIFSEKADFFVPCAQGSVITGRTLDSLQCRVVAGPAYTVFADEGLMAEAHKRGILYAPDFIISSAELFLLDKDLKLDSLKKAKEEAKIIYSVLLDVFTRAREEGVPPFELARKEALERYRKLDQIKNILC